MAAPNIDVIGALAGYRQAEAPSLTNAEQPAVAKSMETPSRHSHDNEAEAGVAAERCPLPPIKPPSSSRRISFTVTTCYDCRGYDGGPAGAKR